MYYRGAAAAIVVYDITRASTFNTLRNWVEELQTKGPKDIAIAIAGNKADLANQRVRTHRHTFALACAIEILDMNANADVIMITIMMVLDL